MIVNKKIDMPQKRKSGPVIVIWQSPHTNIDIEKEIGKRANASILLCQNDNIKEIVSKYKPDVILFTTRKISKATLDYFEEHNVKFLQRYGLGTEDIDLKYASKLGIIVGDTPHYAPKTVSDHAIAMGLSLLRRIPSLERILTAEKGWNVNLEHLPIDPREATVGIIGLGNIGMHTGKTFQALGSRILALDPYCDKKNFNILKARESSLDYICLKSDLIFLHTPLTEKTLYMFAKEEFKKMKRSASIVNTARGKLINESDLIHALRNKVIYGAGLDVFENENNLQGISKNSPFREQNLNVIVTPHSAWRGIGTLEARIRAAIKGAIRGAYKLTPHTCANPEAFKDRPNFKSWIANGSSHNRAIARESGLYD